MPKCVACLSGQDWECLEQGKCSSGEVESSSSNSLLLLSDSSDSGTDSDIQNAEEEDPTAEFTTYKDDSALRDQQSTGRKRAAKMYPLDPEADCDWKMRKNCGGGEFPIVGCLAGKQQARHHGPEKNTLNNEKGNVHRICHVCHNRWHTLNDEGYVWDGIHEPHNPIECSVVDIVMNEEWWIGRKLISAKD